MSKLTPVQQDALLELHEEVRHTLESYPSVLENYLMARSLPILSKEHKFGLFEFYYDCAEIPAFAVKNGVLSTNKLDSEQVPTIIEVMGDQDVVFIQVSGHVILNRVQGDLPEVKAVLVDG